MIIINDIEKTSCVFSYLGWQFLQGNVDVVKFLYGNIWGESPPLIRTIDELQECLTAVEVERDRDGLYNTEFLYYWAMTCIGEQSPLIFKNLGIAETCLKKIQRSIPLTEARLAYIELLKSTDPARAAHNVARLDVLRRWANKQDLFSRIVLAKIAFYSFLMEKQENSADNQNLVIPELPIKVVQLLEQPLQMGHPVAIRFWNDMLACIDAPEVLNQRIDQSRICSSVLYDFKTPANMQIRP